MALTEKDRNEILNLIKGYLDTNSITLSELDDEDNNGDIWVFGTQGSGENKKSVKIELSTLIGKDGETREEVSAYIESDTEPPRPVYEEGGNNNVPPEGWVLEQGSSGVWWRSKAVFEVGSDGKYGKMVRAWSPPIKVSVTDGSTIVSNYRYCSSDSSTSISIKGEDYPPFDAANPNSPNAWWKKDYKLVSEPDISEAYISNPELSAQYNTEVEPRIFLWRTEGKIVDDKYLVNPWNDPIMISAYGGDKGDTPTLTPIVNINASSNLMLCESESDGFKALPNQKITVTAIPQNFKGELDASDVTFEMVGYDIGGSAVGIIYLGVMTDESGVMIDVEQPSTEFTNEDWKAVFARAEVRCTVTKGGKSRSATATIHRHANAKDANVVFGYLVPQSLNLAADNGGNIPLENYQEERSQFILLRGNDTVIDSKTNNPDIEFNFKNSTPGFEVAIVENRQWKCNNTGKPIHNTPTDEGDGTLKIIDFPPGSDNMNIIVEARYKDEAEYNGYASASFSLNKIREPREPDSPIQNTDTEEFIYMLTKGYRTPTIEIKSDYLKSDIYQTDGFVPNKDLHGDNITWTPYDLTWHGEKQNVNEFWDHQWHSRRNRTNGVWGEFKEPRLLNNYANPPVIPDTPQLSVRLDRDMGLFYGHEGEVSITTVLCNLDEIPITPTKIWVGGNVDANNGSYGGIFNFRIDTNQQKITFTLNKKVEVYTIGEIPINITVKGSDRTLYFSYIVFPYSEGTGESTPLLILSATSYFMLTNNDNIAKTGQEITIEAKTININGDVTFSAKAYDDSGASNDITLNGAGKTRKLLSDNWDASTVRVEVTATMPGTSLKDVTTIHRHQDIPDSVSGYLTNGYIVLNPNSKGVITFFDHAKGVFKVRDGSEFVTTGVTFSVFNKTEGCNVEIDTLGNYKVTEMTVDNALVTLRASYKSTIIDLSLTLVKGSEPIVGADSPFVSLSASSYQITRDLTDTDSYYQDSEPKTIEVYAVHSNMEPDLQWSFRADGVGDYSTDLPAGVRLSTLSNDTLIIKTAELTSVLGTFEIKFGGKTSANNIDLHGRLSISIIPYARNGVPGKTPFTRVWVEGEEHRNNIYYVDFIYYRDSENPGRNGWFKLTTLPSLIAPASPYTNTTGTTIIPEYEKIDFEGSKAFNIVIAEEANLAGFIFKNNRLYSQKGLLTKDGVTTANLILDGTNGKIKAVDADIEGKITATSGEIGRFTMEEGYLIGYNNAKRATTGLNANSSKGAIAFWAGGSYNYMTEPEAKSIAYIKHDGTAFFNKADIEGKITATSGEIGGFEIRSGYLIGSNIVNGEKIDTVSLNANSGEKGDNYAFWAGWDNSIYTKIYHNGFLEAKNATVSGNITAESGYIGNFTIKDGYLKGYNKNLTKVTMGLNASKDVNDIAFWAGGDVDDMISPGVDSVAYITHEGKAFFTNADITGTVNAKSGSIGVLDVDTSGQVKLEDPDTGSTRISFIKSEIPLLADLLSTTNFDGSVTAAFTSLTIPSSGSIISYMSGTLDVKKNGADISIAGGAKLSLNGSFDGVADASVVMSLYLMRNDSKYSNLQSVMITKGADIDSTTVYSRTLTGMPSGNYRLMLEVTKVGSGQVSGMGTIESTPMSWTFQQSGIRNFLFGLNGFLSYFSDRHIYFSEEDGFDLRGKTNTPGVLASGTVDANGSQSNTWGAKASTSSTTTASGGRRVPLLNLKHNEYTVQITPHTGTVPFRVGTKTSTGFTALGSGAFDYTVIGRNY